MYRADRERRVDAPWASMDDHDGDALLAAMEAPLAPHLTRYNRSLAA